LDEGHIAVWRQTLRFHLLGFDSEVRFLGLDDSGRVQLIAKFSGHDDASEARAVKPPAHQMIFISLF
jgi:hypothetical protein